MIDFIVHGSGFKAIYFVLSLKNRYPKCKVGLQFEENNFGGVYNPVVHEKFFLDKGCHLFDYNNKRFIELFEINVKKIIPVNLKYANIVNDKISEDYAIMDFRNCISYKESIKNDIIYNLDPNKKLLPENNLLNYFINRFGSLPINSINQLSLKMCGLPLNQIDQRSYEPLFFNRLLITNNEEAIKLKLNGFDNIIAASSLKVHNYSSGFILFTFKESTNGFVKHVKKLLVKKNIMINSNQRGKIEFDTSPTNIKSLNKYNINVPLHLVYFLTKDFPYTYLHDYTSNPVWRVSSPGHYSRQTKDNSSYVCFEITDPYQIYNEGQVTNLAKEYLNQFSIKGKKLYYLFTKFSYPALYKSGSKFKIPDNVINPFAYSKTKIMNNIDRIIDNI